MKSMKLGIDENTTKKDYLPVHKGKAGKMVCICDYELYKVDENTWKCAGGGHVYRLSEGDMIMDKFGNFMIRNPENDRATESKKG